MAIVQIIFDIEKELRNRFKAKVAMEGTTIKDVLTAFVKNYVKEYKTGKRQAALEVEPLLKKLMRLEVLREVKSGGRAALDWFEGKIPLPDARRGQATTDLLEMGLIERVPEYPRRPRPFRLTTRGEAFLEEVFVRIGRGGVKLDWNRVGEIEFPIERVRVEEKAKG